MRRHQLLSTRFLAVMTALFAVVAISPLMGALSSPALAISTCTSTRSTNDSDEQAVVGMINSLRTSSGLPALTATAALTRAAISKSSDMAGSGTFAHDDIMSTMARFAACGNNSMTIGENIAAGNSDPTATFNQWLNSPEHKANMVSPSFKAIGIGRAYGTYQGLTNYAFWTTEFSDVVDSSLPSGGATVTNPAQPTFPLTPTTPVNGSGGLVGYGSFSGNGAPVPSYPILPPSSPVFPYGQGAFGGGNGYVPANPAPSSGGSGGLVGNGSLPATGGSGPTPTETGAQGTSVGWGSFP